MTLTKRQSILITLLVIVLLFLAWEIYKTVLMFEGDVPITSSIPSAQKLATVVSRPQQVSVPNNFSEANISEANTKTAQPKANINRISASQAAYIRLINQYQVLEIEQKIAASNQSIAELRLKTAQAQEELSQLSAPMTNELLPQQAAAQLKPESQAKHYQLVYTGQQQGKWNATLKKGDRLIDVVVGSHIAGGNVVAINNNSVILNHVGKRLEISFTGESRLPTSRPAEVLKKFTALSSTTSNASSTSAAKTRLKAKEAPAKQTKPSVTAASNEQEQALINKLTHLPLAAPAISKLSGLKAEHDLDKNITAITVPPTPTYSVKKIQEKTATTKTKMKGAAQAINKTNAKSTQSAKRASHSKATQQFQNQYSPTAMKILAQNPSTYTIQLISSYKKYTVTRYRQRYHSYLGNGAYPFVTSRHGRPWYVLVYGQFKTSADAVNAINKLPLAMKKWRPFIKKFRNIQAEIEKSAIGMPAKG